MDTIQVCSLCGDTGWKATGEGRDRRVTRCDCRREERGRKLLELARIPERYNGCDFNTYKPANDLQFRAQKVAQAFAEVYPVEKRGLVFVGSIGIGKTHLAVSIVKTLVVQKGITCLFYDYGDLLKEIQDSYNPESNRTEL